VYDIEDITFQGPLDDFWRDPGKPDAETFAAFRRVLIDRCLVAGGFFSEQALAKLIPGVITRLEAASPLKSAARADQAPRMTEEEAFGDRIEVFNPPR